MASTSFAFMLADVPAPAWYQSTANWSWYFPSITARPARSMASSLALSSPPIAWFAQAAAIFTIARASTNSGVSRSVTPEIRKFSSARAVWTPY
jgi:hypothetical protein